MKSKLVIFSASAAALVLLAILAFYARPTRAPVEPVTVVSPPVDQTQDPNTSGTPASVEASKPSEEANVPKIDPVVASTVLAAARAKLGLDMTDIVNIEKRSGNYYYVSAYPPVGGGGVWMIVADDAEGARVLIIQQDNPNCNVPELKEIPIDLVPTCYSSGDNPQLINRNTGTVAQP